MANLFFPQLTSGALAQYPIRKTAMVRTVKNLLPDGTMLLYSDPKGGHLLWQLRYTELSNVDLALLQNHFSDCAGPFHAFTFIDPTANMLAWSTDLTQAVWNPASQVAIAPGIADPAGGTSAFSLSNNGQIALGVTQSLAVPANYRYCLSLYVHSSAGANVTLTQSGSQATNVQSFPAAAQWNRLVLSGQLNDPSTSYSVLVAIDAGQQCDVYGVQLEAQPAPSRYVPTGSQGGVYPNAHWGVDQLQTVASAFGQFAAAFTVETTL